MKKKQIQNNQRSLNIGHSPHKLSLNSNTNAKGNSKISKLTKQSLASIYLNSKHQITKEKIEKMRHEEYNKMIAEVKDKPTLSKNSKLIIKRIFKDKDNHNIINKDIKAKSPHKGFKRNQSNLYLNYSNQIYDYKMIIESRVQRIKAISQQKKLILKRSQSAKFHFDRKHLNNDTRIKSQKGKEFNQQYIPYDEIIVFNVRDKLQKYYDNKTITPINHISHNDSSSIDYNKQSDRHDDVGLMVTSKFGQQNNCNYQSIINKQKQFNANCRRVRDIQLLTAFAEGLNQN